MAERQCKLSRKFKAMDLDDWQLGLISVMAPLLNFNTIQRTTEGAAQLELACLEEARQKFTQAKDTPFPMELLRSIFGDQGMESMAFHKVLNRTFICPPETNQ